MAFNGNTSLPSGPARPSAAPSPSRSLLKFSGVNGPYELEGWNLKLKLIREILLTREPEVAEYPTAVRLYIRFLATSTTLSRKGTMVLHYRFYDLGAV
jgi:hypothetical protein